MTTTRLTGLFLCGTALDRYAPNFAPDGGGNSYRAKPKVNPAFTALEPRVLFDAAGADTFNDLVDGAAPESQDLDDAGHDALIAALEATPLDLPATKNIVFIDSAVEDIDVLIADIGPDAEIYILNAEQDGVEQMAAILDGRSGIESISVISHGRSGTLDLGSAKLTEASIHGRHADEMAIIRGSLAADADILLYGCEFGAGTRGQTALQALADATGADVAASDDLTGAAELGGDWVLEDVVGGERNAGFNDSRGDSRLTVRKIACDACGGV